MRGEVHGNGGAAAVTTAERFAQQDADRREQLARWIAAGRGNAEPRPAKAARAKPPTGPAEAPEAVVPARSPRPAFPRPRKARWALVADLPDDDLVALADAVRAEQARRAR